LQKKNLDEAVTAFESCLKIRPDYSQALVNLGTAYEEKGLPEKAEQEYKKAFDIDANSQASFYLAKLYAKQKKLEPALDFIQKFLAKNERSAPAHNILGVILNEMGKYPEAIQSFRRALALTPQDVSLSVNLGIACINNKEFAEAREILQKALPLIEDQALKEKVKEYLELIK
jgi:Tfp pilus assembly protein PilF